MKIFSTSLHSVSLSLLTRLGVLFVALVFFNPGYADAIDDATANDIADLCASSPPFNELSKIVNKKSNTDEMRRNALARMIEVSRECSNASALRLKQYHQKLINGAHKVIGFSAVESRRVAVEGFQYVIMQPDNVQPAAGAITRGQTIANLALTDSDVEIRLWALEALVTVRGENPLVQSTLTTASTSDPETIVQQTAAGMLAELFGP